MSGFGLASVKEQGKSVEVDAGAGPSAPSTPTTWIEFNVPDERIQEVVDHMAKIGIDCDPRGGA